MYKEYKFNAGQDYPLGTIGTMPIAYEKVAYKALNLVYKSEDLSFIPHLFLEKMAFNLKSAYGLQYP